MSSSRKRGGRRLRVALGSAIAAVGVSAVGVSSASAVQAVFDHGSLKLPLASFEIVTPADPVEVDNFPNVGGAYDIIPGDVDFPPFSGEPITGVTVDVQLAPTENLSGTYNEVTGELTGDTSDWSATMAVNGAPCVISGIPMAFTTGDNAVFQGDPFEAGSPPTDGSISHAWTGLPAGVGAGCTTIGALTGGAGGIWLSNGVVTPTLTPAPPEDPATPPSSTPKKKKCKKKKGKKGADAAKKKKCKKKKK